MDPDYSLMNPVYLRGEIHDLDEMIKSDQEFSDTVHTRIQNLFDTLPNWYGIEQITLTPDQMTEIVQVLAMLDMNRWRYTQPHKFALKMYRQLLTDRRWIIATKFNILKHLKH